MRCITYGLGKIEKEKIEPIKNEVFIKPLGGLWTCPVNSTRSWKDWCIGNQIFLDKLKTSCEFEVKEDNLYRINSGQDFLDLYQRFPNLTWPQDKYIKLLDFEAISKVYSGIWLTPQGLEDNSLFTTGFFGWDCETILILNNDILTL